MSVSPGKSASLNVGVVSKVLTSKYKHRASKYSVFGLSRLTTYNLLLAAHIRVIIIIRDTTIVRFLIG